MNREEMIAKMQEIGCDGRSKMKMRSESLQAGRKSKRYKSLKKALKKNSKLLVFTEIAIPFNPETGEADDKFNPDSKYRPPFSATTVALSLKELANQNEITKNAFMRRAGVSEWDTSDCSKLTEEDWTIFAKYRVPRIFTIPVVHINVPVMTKSQYGKDYAIHVDRDPDTGEVVGEVPAVLQAYELFQGKLYEEVREYTDKLDKGLIKDTEQVRKDTISQIYQKNPYSEDHPSNSVLAIELPLTTRYEVSADVSLGTMAKEDVADCVVISKYNKKMRECIGRYQDGGYSKFDKYFDFFEMEMACPVDGDENTDRGKQQLGLDTKFEKPTNALYESEACETFLESVREFLDEETDCEETVRRSVFVAQYTEDVDAQVITSLPTVLDLKRDKYVTTNLLKRHAQLISCAFGDKGDELLDEVMAGISDKASGEEDVDTIKNEAKAYDLSSDEFNDDFDDVAVEEIGID